jgi:pyruvate dehydrogenase E2 component (dihydrolipoamide acetyltransferase)
MAEIFRLPELFTGLESAVITDWELAEGAQFAHGALLATAETDKASVELEAPHDGVLLKILTPQGGRVLVDGPVAVLGGVGEAADAVDELLAAEGLSAADSAPASTTPEPSPESSPESSRASAADRHPDGAPADSHGRIFASPLVRRLAREQGVPLDALAGTGPGGRIRRVDLERHLEGGRHVAVPDERDTEPASERAELDVAPSRTPVLDADYLEVPAGGMRRIVAARMAQSKAETPHFYLRGSARMDALMAMRSQINDGSDVRVSVNDLIVKAVAAAHARHPEMNVSWVDGSIRHWRHVDVGVAIATSRGLVTPVVRQVDRATVTAIAAEIRDLAARADEGDLRLDELEGGSISVTNLGMYGTEEFSGIINPSQSAILAVGAVRDEPVVEDGMITVGKVARFTLSVDHRPLDGVMAAEWMRTFLMLVESPLKLLA